MQRQHGHDVSDTFSTEMKHTSEFFTALLSNDRHGRSRMIVFQKSVPKGKIQQHSSPVVAMLLGTFTHMNIGQ